MTWVEQVLHLDPDGGSGLFEATLALFAAVGMGLAAARRRRIGRPSDEGASGA